MDAISICGLIALGGVAVLVVVGLLHDRKRLAKLPLDAAALGYEHLLGADDFVEQNLHDMHRFRIGRVSNLFTGPEPTFFVHGVGKRTEGRTPGNQLVAAQRIPLPVFVLRRRPGAVFGLRAQAIGPEGMPGVPLPASLARDHGLFAPESAPGLAPMLERVLAGQGDWEIESDGTWVVVMRHGYPFGPEPLEARFALRRKLLERISAEAPRRQE